MATLGQIMPSQSKAKDYCIEIKNIEDKTSLGFYVQRNVVKKNTYRFLPVNETGVITIDNWVFPGDDITVESGETNKGYLFFSALIGNKQIKYQVEIDLPTDKNGMAIEQNELFFLIIYSKAITLLAIQDNTEFPPIDLYESCKLRKLSEIAENQ